ncbi:hypothetical protein HPB49_024464 [Dermacentor silvarum]|uniref:Uncharacterized protein n=1 Tax=Dermacentor silvarum TaxID=543639 RepID=A0ACB8E465_DERSI|nr:uncharacterized protein LOC119461872 [Dermacentor silvarum]KAH7981472.1 hypothetical protein HPB49_024464 [Dermacentor silvarum]
MSQRGNNHRDERPQGTSHQEGLFCDAEVAPQDQGPAPRQRDQSTQVGGDKEPVAAFREEFKKILKDIRQQHQIEDEYLSGLKERLGAQVAELLEEFVNSVTERLMEKRRTALKIILETKDALQRVEDAKQRIAELDKVLENARNVLRE